MYEELYAKLPDLDACLARIGLSGQTLPPTPETLSAVISAALTHIPFENLDAWDRGEAPQLGIPAIFDKVVVRRRGGWCFELNALLRALLEALGFAVYSVGARVILDRAYRPAISHHGVVCALDGKHYYCDIGFGGVMFRGAVPMDGTLSPYGFFTRQNGLHTELWQDGATPRALLMFRDEPYEAVDFLYANFANAVDTALPFRTTLHVSRLTADGHRLLLRDGFLTETDGARRISSVAVPDRTALTAALLEQFGIDYPCAKGK